MSRTIAILLAALFTFGPLSGRPPRCIYNLTTSNSSGTAESMERRHELECNASECDGYDAYDRYARTQIRRWRHHFHEQRHPQ